MKGRESRPQVWYLRDGVDEREWGAPQAQVAVLCAERMPSVLPPHPVEEAGVCASHAFWGTGGY